MQDGGTLEPKEVRKVITKTYVLTNAVWELNILLVNKTNTIEYFRIKQLLFLCSTPVFYIIIMWKTDKTVQINTSRTIFYNYVLQIYIYITFCKTDACICVLSISLEYIGNCFYSLFSVLMRLLVSISSELIFKAFKKLLWNTMTWS